MGAFRCSRIGVRVRPRRCRDCWASRSRRIATADYRQFKASSTGSRPAKPGFRSPRGGRPEPRSRLVSKPALAARGAPEGEATAPKNAFPCRRKLTYRRRGPSSTVDARGLRGRDRRSGSTLAGIRGAAWRGSPRSGGARSALRCFLVIGSTRLLVLASHDAPLIGPQVYPAFPRRSAWPWRRRRPRSR